MAIPKTGNPRLFIRPMLPDDVPALTEILNEIIRAGRTTAYEIEMTAGSFNTAFLSGPDVIASSIAEDGEGGPPIGFQTIERNVDLPAGWADIATFARSKSKIPGVGTALFTATRQRATACKLQAINATIRADNAGGLAYYDKIGFRTYRTIEGMPLLSGEPIDRICKRFDLESSFGDKFSTSVERM